jgi:hypothetical protein
MPSTAKSAAGAICKHVTKCNAGQRWSGAPPGVPSLSRGTPHSRVANGRPHSAHDADRSTQPSWRWRQLTVPFDVGADHRARITILSFVCCATTWEAREPPAPAPHFRTRNFGGSGRLNSRLPTSSLEPH